MSVNYENTLSVVDLSCRLYNLLPCCSIILHIVGSRNHFRQFLCVTVVHIQRLLL